MLITGKVIEICKPNNNKDIYNVVIGKTRKGKKIIICIVFWGKLSASIQNNLLKIGDKIDVQFYVYSKMRINYGVKYFDTFIVAEHWRKYIKGQARFKEIANTKTGEVIKIKNKIDANTNF